MNQEEYPQCEISLLKSIQDKMAQLLINAPYVTTEEDEGMLRKYIDMLRNQSEEIMTFIQVMLRVKEELAHARLDFERCLYSNTDVLEAKKRVELLTGRLKNLSKICRYSFFDFQKQSSKPRNFPDDSYSSNFKTISSNQDSKQKPNCLDSDLLCQMGKSVEKRTLDDIQAIVKRVLDASDDLPISRQIKAYVFENNTTAYYDDNFLKTCTNYEKNDNIASNIQETINPLSWHSITQTNQVNKNEECSTFESSRNEKLKLNSLISHQHDAMVQLINRLHNLYSSMDEIPATKVDERTYEVNGSKGFKCKMKTSSERILPYIGEKSCADSPNINLGMKKSSCDNEYISSSLILTSRKEQRNPKKPVFPRSPSVWCHDFPCNSSTLSNHAYSPKPPSQKTKRRIIDLPQVDQSACKKIEKSLAMKRAVARAKAIAKIKRRLANVSKSKVEDQKIERIESLLGKSGILSDNSNIAIDAAKALSQLKCETMLVTKGLRSVIEKDNRKLLVYECAKALILLGSWQDSHINILTHHLKHGNKKVQADILSAILKSHNAQFISKSSETLINLSDVLLDLLESSDQEIAFNSALSLGHLCINKEKAKWFLLDTLKSSNFSTQHKALNVLVKQMNCQVSEVIDSILFLLSNANCWKHRLDAVELLSHIDIRRLKAYSLKHIFDVLLELLFNHPNEKLRFKVATVLKELGMRKEACINILKRLGDKNDSVRADAIIALATLEMKGEKELKILLDMFDLDSSTYVRTQVIKAFVDLKWNHPHILRVLEERQKADDVIAVKAMKAFEYLSTINC